jgi:hypothetical protein
MEKEQDGREKEARSGAQAEKSGSSFGEKRARLGNDETRHPSTQGKGAGGGGGASDATRVDAPKAEGRGIDDSAAARSARTRTLFGPPAGPNGKPAAVAGGTTPAVADRTIVPKPKPKFKRAPKPKSKPPSTAAGVAASGTLPQSAAATRAAASASTSGTGTRSADNVDAVAGRASERTDAAAADADDCIVTGRRDGNQIWERSTSRSPPYSFPVKRSRSGSGDRSHRGSRDRDGEHDSGGEHGGGGGD